MTASQPIDPGAFAALEHAGWSSQTVVDEYNESFTGLTRQAIAPLLDAVGVRHGVRLLDVATGPGSVAAAAAERGASVVGLDFSATMLAEARQRHSAVAFQEGDAEALSFPADSFDAVTMNFGMLHLARPEQALAEACRVLRPGGRFGFTVWASPAVAVGFQIVLQAIQRNGNADVPLPPGPPFFRFSDPTECRRALTAAGFIEPASVQVPLIWRLRSADALFSAFHKGTARTGALLRAQTSEDLEAIRAAIGQATRAYQKDGMIVLPMPAILSSAVKPD